MSRRISPPRIEANAAGIFEIRWTANGRGNRQSTGETDMEKAKITFGEWLQNQEKSSKVNINSILDFYISNHVEEQCLDQQRVFDCCKPLRIELGELAPLEITADVVKRYKKNRFNGLTTPRKVGDSTIRRELITLIAAINFAEVSKLIKVSEIPKISLPPVAPPKDIWLTLQEERQFVQLAGNFNRGRLSRIFRFVMIALETAARKTSILELEWTQVDFSQRLINFQKNNKRQKNKRRVAVPISDRLLPWLQRAYAERISEYVLDTPFSIQHHFDALKRLAVDVIGKKALEITPHVLRHTWATLAAQRGTNLREIAGVLADTQATVDRVYAHHCPEYLRNAVNFRDEN